MNRTSDGPRTGFVDELKDAVSVRAAVLVIGVLALQLAFITSYIGAFHNPKPHEIPLAVVTPAAQITDQAVQRLSALPGDPLDPRAVEDEATAVRQIQNRDVDGALIVDPRGAADKLLVAERIGRLALAGSHRGHRHDGKSAAADGGRRGRGPQRQWRRARALLVLPGHRLVRGRLSVRRDPRDQPWRAARQYGACPDQTGCAARVLDRGKPAGYGDRGPDPGRAARQHHGPVGARHTAGLRGRGDHAGLPGPRGHRRCRTGDPAGGRLRQSERRMGRMPTCCCRRSGGPSDRRCRRARAPSRRARSRTSRATA